jgi:16S rRNA (cytidine1402-2'-O)-methyltransferase
VSVAGDTHASGFCFVGFLPARGAERHQALKALAEAPSAQVLFEAPHRIEALARELARACGGRTLTLCRELTKQFESITTLAAAQLPDWLAADANRLRGEFVLVLHALEVHVQPEAAARHDATLQTLMSALPLKQAVALAAELTGAPRNALYSRALALKGGGEQA